MNHQHDNDPNHTKISTARLEAFSDGVIAIIITITVLEFKIPAGMGWSALKPIIPLFIAYAVSFHAVGTYWNNHHHLLRVTNHVSTGIMWANLNLLFWLSLIPFVTGWLGANHGGKVPTALYAALLLMCALSYTLLLTQVVKHSENHEQLAKELTTNPKGFISVISYAGAIVFAFFIPAVSDVLIILVALMWFIPDRRIEKYI